MKKILVIGSILLFIGVAIAPSFTQSNAKASRGDDLIVVTTQACGIPGCDDTTVKLTRQQYQDLEQYLVEFRAKLNLTSTPQETIVLFKRTIGELDTYGLLPQRMNQQETLRVLTENSLLFTAMKSHYLSLGKNPVFNDTNFFCLVTGTTRGAGVVGFPELGVAALLYLIAVPYVLGHLFGHEPVIIENIITWLRNTSTVLRKIAGSRIIQTSNIVFGTSLDEYIPPEFRYLPACGWIDTQGILGKRSWNGTFFGSIRNLPNFEFRGYTYYIGATGFVGIKLRKDDGSTFFLGSALQVDLDYFEF